MMTSVANTENHNLDNHTKKSLTIEPPMNQNPEVFSVIPGVIQNMDVVEKPVKCYVEGTWKM